MSGFFYLGGAIALGLGFLYYAVMLMLKPADTSLPMRTFGYSILYLLALFTFLLIDHYMPTLVALFG